MINEPNCKKKDFQPSQNFHPAAAHRRQLKGIIRRFCSGSGFPAAISAAERRLFRGWKAAPTAKTTNDILKLTRMRCSGTKLETSCLALTAGSHIDLIFDIGYTEIINCRFIRQVSD